MGSEGNVCSILAGHRLEHHPHEEEISKNPGLASSERSEKIPGPPAVMARDRCLVVGYLVGGVVPRDAANRRGPGTLERVLSDCD